MLINLQTIYRPHTLNEAVSRLREPDTYPLYGSGAYLIRAEDAARREVQHAVDLSGVIHPTLRYNEDGDLYLGSGATLAALAAFDMQLRPYVEADAPLTLRTALTLGDLLMECRPDSLLLALLYGLVGRIDTPERGGDDWIEIPRWMEMPREQRRRLLIQGVIVPRYGRLPWRFAFAKVARTPADAPIVAAIGFASTETPDPGAYAVVTGLAPRPMRYQPGMASLISDYKGSAEYRAEMAGVLAEQAIAAAREKVK